MKRIFKVFFNLYHFCKRRVVKSIRLELVGTFSICLVAAFIIGSWYNGYYKESHMIVKTDYNKGIQDISNHMNSLKDQLNNKTSNDNINEIINNNIEDNIKIYITDDSGKVMYKSNNSKESKLDIHEVIMKAEDFKRQCDNATIMDSENGIVQKIISFEVQYEDNEIDAITFDNKSTYLIITGNPKSRAAYIRPTHSLFFSGLLGIAVFIFIFYFLTNKKMEYIESILEGLNKISKGDLKYKINLIGEDELKKLADNINSMAGELEEKIEKERAAEKTKSELITNVSHDLRTPLTSIKGYLLLLKEKKYKSYAQLEDFVGISYNKSEKLEKLINDLFEYTKLSNRVIELNKTKLCLDGLLEQLTEELYVICKESNTVIEKEIMTQNVYVNLDGDKMVRVFENLLMNAVRYSTKPGTIKLKLQDKKTSVLITVENKCEHINKDELERIFNRFYRREKSRSEASGGSGLGLAIAKSIVELHKGRIWAESEEENVRFLVELPKS
ncbi:sensor histidine kinase [Clostridium felsineum]|uniref:sensor histidine kinase n=1 Tax=Clostridium felsineum TaxID=36839 RepID=UPI00098CC392|nr:HAMP domain-containing sensor histidine kinase [Clostridium felsineum]